MLTKSQKLLKLLKLNWVRIWTGWLELLLESVGWLCLGWRKPKFSQGWGI